MRAGVSLMPHALKVVGSKQKGGRCTEQGEGHKKSQMA